MNLPIQEPIFGTHRGRVVVIEVYGHYFSNGKVIEYSYDVARRKDRMKREMSTLDSAVWPLSRVTEGIASFMGEIDSLVENTSGRKLNALDIENFLRGIRGN